MDLTQNICHNTDKVTLIFTKSIIIQSDFIGSVIFHCDFFSFFSAWMGCGLELVVETLGL